MRLKLSAENKSRHQMVAEWILSFCFFLSASSPCAHARSCVCECFCQTCFAAINFVAQSFLHELHEYCANSNCRPTFYILSNIVCSLLTFTVFALLNAELEVILASEFTTACASRLQMNSNSTTLNLHFKMQMKTICLFSFMFLSFISFVALLVGRRSPGTTTRLIVGNW